MRMALHIMNYFILLVFGEILYCTLELIALLEYIDNLSYSSPSDITIPACSGSGYSLGPTPWGPAGKRLGVVYC